MGLLEVQLAGVLDDDNALPVRNVSSQDIQ